MSSCFSYNSREKYMPTYLYRTACANFKYYIFFIANYTLIVHNWSDKRQG